MNFLDELDPSQIDRVNGCDLKLLDPARLAALERIHLMDSKSDEAFDRLARLAARILKVPLTIVSLVSDKRQFFVAAHGLPPPYDVLREVPIDTSVCRYTLQGDEIIAADTKTHPFLKFHPTIESWNIQAFIAIPIITPDQHVLGAFCAVDHEVRSWTEDDIEVMRELTQSVMTEINLRMQIRDHEAERKLRETFVAALTHDLRTPLTIAKMSAQFIQKFSVDVAKVEKMSDRIISNMDRADTMIVDLLDVNRMKAGEPINLQITSFELNTWLTNLIKEWNELRGGIFEFKACGTELLVQWDQTAIRRVLENLASNGVKYGKPGAKVTISASSADQLATIEVHNEGVPIPEKDLGTLFDPFHRSPTAVSGGQKGWGIGLSLVKGLVESHHGKVSVQSDEHSGTRFL